jgi:hypothetical protein
VCGLLRAHQQQGAWASAASHASEAASQTFTVPFVFLPGDKTMDVDDGDVVDLCSSDDEDNDVVMPAAGRIAVSMTPPSANAPSATSTSASAARGDEPPAKRACVQAPTPNNPKDEASHTAPTPNNPKDETSRTAPTPTWSTPQASAMARVDLTDDLVK